MGAEPVTVAVVGAGGRGGRTYAAHLERHPERGRLAAVCDPDPRRREPLADRHGVPASRRYARWDDLFRDGRIADALVVATPDALHVEPAVRALEQGYHVLLEKPIALDEAGVRRVQEAERASSGTVTVCHVLRYTPFFAALKRLLGEGPIGALVTVNHTENVGYWHFAHSFVRGNWRNTREAAPAVLQKTCHDLDVLRWLVGVPVRGVRSFGSLLHFRPENAPLGATARCADGCAVERECPYSALRLYLEPGPAAELGRFVLAPDGRPESLEEAVREGPYGRCVYACDNNVVDHQATILEFENGATAVLHMSAFSEENTRTVKIMGSHGELRGHMGRGEIEWRDFRTGRRELIEVEGRDAHGGGDDALTKAFLARVRAARDGEAPPPDLTSLGASVESHLLAFAAERSRLES